MRGPTHTRLSTLKVKTRRLTELTTNLSEKVAAKSEILNKTRDNIKELAVYIENAYFFDFANIHKSLALDIKPPNDDAGFIEYIGEILNRINDFDTKKFALPENFLIILKDAKLDVVPIIHEIERLKKRKSSLVREREDALEAFREIIPPIRKWLWKMLPEGRKDTRLENYGFKSYGS